jgi:serine 3-dehydrogenase (NADP+)
VSDNEVFSRRTVLVVGASRGTGWSVVRVLSASGFHVIGWSRTEVPATPESDIIFQKVDIKQVGDVTAGFHGLLLAKRVPSIVVHVAAIARWGSVGEQSTEDWREVLETNVVGAFTVLDQYAKVFGRHPSQVIGVASDAARFAAAGRSAYHTSKAAIASFFESYRLEVRPFHTRVTVVYPGKVNTSLSSRSAVANAAALSPDDVANLVHHLLMLDDHIEIRAVEMSSIHSPYGPQ